MFSEYLMKNFASGVVDKNTAPIIAILESRFDKLEFIVVFGSFAAGSADESSDLDIAILTKCNVDEVDRWNVANDIAMLVKRDVDLVDLKKASTVLKMQIVTHGRLIMGDQEQFDAYAANIMTMYQHLQQERKSILEAFIRENFSE